MKKILSLVLAVVLLCGCMLTLVACGGGLSGKYESGLTTYEFKGKNFTRTTSVAGFSYTAAGTYEITEKDDGTMEITITLENDDDDIKSGTYVFEEGENYIKIGLVKYDKVEK